MASVNYDNGFGGKSRNLLIANELSAPAQETHDEGRRCCHARHAVTFKGQRVYLLVRRCWCGRLEDRGDVLSGEEGQDEKEETLVRADGVELHFSEKCCWTTGELVFMQIFYSALA